MIASPSSRYYGLPVQEFELRDDTKIAWLGRRLVPLPERFAQIGEHVVAQGERPDHVAARHLGDPEQFWRLCDSNGVLAPDELTERPGHGIRITLPEGIPGPASA